MKCFCFNCSKETDMLLDMMVAQCKYIKHHGYCVECGDSYIRIIPKTKHL